MGIDEINGIISAILRLQSPHTKRLTINHDEEGLMKIKAIIMLSVMVMAGMMAKGPALGGETNRASLEAIVNNYISACEAKSAMLNSSSENIRRAAMLSCLRATFCRKSKSELIDEMIARNVKPKPYKVHHFLNARFNEVVDSNQLALK